MKRDNVARTEQDYNAGILNGKTVFPFNQAGDKNMTMRTKYGNVPYPIKYRGTTNGKLTDQGVAQPNEDFVVNGDTVIEEPDFDKMTFSEALKHSKASNLGSFVWRGKEYKTGKMQRGGMTGEEGNTSRNDESTYIPNQTVNRPVAKPIPKPTQEQLNNVAYMNEERTDNYGGQQESYNEPVNKGEHDTYDPRTDFAHGMENYVVPTWNAVGQTLNAPAAFVGETVAGMNGSRTGDKQSLRNVIPEFMGGTGNQTTLSNELGITNPVASFFIDAVGVPKVPSSLFKMGAQSVPAMRKMIAPLSKGVVSKLNERIDGLKDLRDVFTDPKHLSTANEIVGAHALGKAIISTNKIDSTFNPVSVQNRLLISEKKNGGSIHIDPSKRGTFTAAATKHGESVQGFATQVLANKENYSPAMVKKANFARNASRWKHEDGGYTDSVYPTLEPGAKNLIRDGRDYNYNWKTYFVPSSNAGAPIGSNSIMQQGGKVGYDPAINYTRQTTPQMQQPLFNQNSLQSTDVPQVKLPAYKCGQMIHYRHGGEIRAGVIKEYDERIGKIKLY
jgi:hypothetical protein